MLEQISLAKGQPFRFTQPHGRLYCLFKALSIGDTFARDVEGRAVVNGSPYEGQPQGHAHALLEAVHLYWNMSLVVIHGQDSIEFPAEGAIKHRIGREGAASVYGQALGFPYRRLDLLDLLERGQAGEQRRCQQDGVDAGR